MSCRKPHPSIATSPPGMQGKPSTVGRAKSNTEGRAKSTTEGRLKLASRRALGGTSGPWQRDGQLKLSREPQRAIKHRTKSPRFSDPASNLANRTLSERKMKERTVRLERREGRCVGYLFVSNCGCNEIPEKVRRKRARETDAREHCSSGHKCPEMIDVCTKPVLKREGNRQTKSMGTQQNRDF